MRGDIDDNIRFPGLQTGYPCLCFGNGFKDDSLDLRSSALVMIKSFEDKLVILLVLSQITKIRRPGTVLEKVETD